MDVKIDPTFWYGERQVGYCPKHFTMVKDVDLTNESYDWILNQLTGRFCLLHGPMMEEDTIDIFKLSLGECVAFEDPKEAMMFRLAWS